MAGKLLCASMSSDIVRQVAKKYNITNKQAWTVINNARDMDSTLENDDLSFEFIEQTTAFKDALSVFVQEQVESDSIFSQIPSENEDNDAIVNAIFGTTGEKITDYEAQEIRTRLQDMNLAKKASKDSSSKIYSIIHAFPDPRRLEFLGDWVMRSMIANVTLLEFDANVRKDKKIPEMQSRKDYFTNPVSSTKIRKAIRLDLLDYAADIEDENPQLASEIKLVADNLSTILYMFGDRMFAAEGVRFNINGDSSSTDADADSVERNQSDEDPDDNADLEVTSIGAFSTSQQDKSVQSKLMPSIKTLLYTLYDTNSRGEDISDPYGYGMPTFVDTSVATNTLLKILNGCRTQQKMLKRLSQNKYSVPWINQIISYLDPSLVSDDSITEPTDYISSGKREQLRTMFFRSFRKQFIPFRTAFQWFNKDGELIFSESNRNVNNTFDKLQGNVFRLFRKRNGAYIFSDGQINFDRVDEVDNDIRATSSEIANVASNANTFTKTDRNGTHFDFKKAMSELLPAERKVKDALKKLGIDVSSSVLEQFYANSSDLTPQTEWVSISDDENAQIFNLRVNRLMELAEYAQHISDNLFRWGFAQQKGETKDTPKTDIFAYGESDYDKASYIRNWYNNTIELLAEFSPDSIESMARLAGKSHYSWNNPSAIQTIVEEFNTADYDERKEFILDRYGKDAIWFMKPESTEDNPVFYSDWLNEILNGVENGEERIQYSEKPVFAGVKYEQLSDLAYNLAILNDYFSPQHGKRNRAWYRMLISSDKPRYASINFYRYSQRDSEIVGNKEIYGEDDFRMKVARQAQEFLVQEMRRSMDVINSAVKGESVKFDGYDLDTGKDYVKKIINKIKNKEKVTLDDVVADGRYVFRGSGASFYMNKFIISEIENKTELGEYIVDRVFNSNLHQNEDIFESGMSQKFRDAFHAYMKRMQADYFKQLKEAGLFAMKKKVDKTDRSVGFHLRYLIGQMKNWHQDDEMYLDDMYTESKRATDLAAEDGVDLEENPEFNPYYQELAMFMNDIEEYVYNNWLAKANMSQLFSVDLAFYKNTTNFQKRNAQGISSGYPIDVDATIHGDRVLDENNFYRSVTLRTKNIGSLDYSVIKAALKAREREITDPILKRQFAAQSKTILGELKDKIDATDGQSYTSLTGLRKRMVGLGEWTRSDNKDWDINGVDDEGNTVFTDEAVYWRFRNGTLTPEDFMYVFAQVQKPFVYAMASVTRANGRTLTYPVQHKNSEFALVFLSAFTAQANKKSPLAAIARFMEESAEKDITKGIDTVNWDSSVKIGGNNKAIDISNMNGDEVYAALHKAVYDIAPDGTRSYKRGVVTEYDATSYKIVQDKPEHFKSNAQPAGSQKKILAISNLSDSEMITLPDGTRISGKMLKARYFDALARKTARSIHSFKKKIGLLYPRSSGIHALSVTLKNLIATDSKFDSDARQGLSVVSRDGIEQFSTPLDDPTVQGPIESLILSQIRKAYYRQKTNGGILVQVSSWGSDEDLHIRFYSSNPVDINSDTHPGLLPTIDEFAKEHPEFAGNLQRQYDEYVSLYNNGYAYFECERPITDDERKLLTGANGEIDEKYFNPDGSWNMEEVGEVISKKRRMGIAYYLPTEGKNSILVCYAKRFTPEFETSHAKYPQDITKFTGKDFDIDTTTLELYPSSQDNPDYDDDAEIFDLQLAALRSKSALGETFKYGEFADLSQLSYYAYLLDTHKYSTEYLKSLSPKALKDLCMFEEDLDLMSPVTDTVLHNQNSDAKDMIAIAAVGITSHSFMTLYNSEDDNNPNRQSKLNRQNFLRIVLRPGGQGKVSERFTVVNDEDKNNITSRVFGDPQTDGEVLFDMLYDMDGRLISDEVSKYVGASADAAKDAAEYRLNITKDTLPKLILLHRMGVSSNVARMFIAQPVIKDVVRKLKSSSAFNSAKIDNVLLDVRHDIVERYNRAHPDAQLDEEALWKDVTHATDIRLVYSELEANKAEPYKSVQYDLQLLHVFETLCAMSNRIRNLDSFTRYNSHNAMRGTTFISRLVTRKGLTQLENNLNKENGRRILLPQDVEINSKYQDSEYGRLCSMFPYIADTILGETAIVADITDKFMRTYSPSFFRAIDELDLLNDVHSESTKQRTVELLYSAWKNYQLFVGENRIVDFRDPQIAQYYTRDFADIYENELKALRDSHKFDDVLRGNTFIGAIYPKPAGEKNDPRGFDILSANTVNMGITAREKFKRDWEALLKYPETKKLALGVAYHFLARSAAFSRDTATVDIPNGIKDAIPNYYKAFEEADKTVVSEEELGAFLITFCRNNVNENGVVPKFYTPATSEVRVADYQEPEEDDNGIGYLVFNQKLSTKLLNWLNEDEDTLTTSLFTVVVDDVLYAVMDNEVMTDKNPDTGEESYILRAVPVSPLGIPGQMSEYVGFDSPTSILDEEKLSDADTEALSKLEEPFIHPIIEGSLPQGRRVGSFISDAPFGYIDPKEYTTTDLDYFLEKPEKESSRNAFIESRRYIRRLKKAASALGIRIDGIHQALTSDYPSYILNVWKSSKDKFNANQHEEALKLAAIASMLGIKPSENYTTVKSYVKSAEEANAIELSVKISGSEREILKALEKGNIEYEYNSDTKSVQILIDMDSIQEVKSQMNEIARILGPVSKFISKEANYVVVDYIGNEERKEILNRIINEEQEKQARPNDSIEDTKVSGKSGGRKDGFNKRLYDLATLALEVSEGTKTVNDVGEYFEDSSAHMRSAQDSFVSFALNKKIVDEMYDSDAGNAMIDVINEKYWNRPYAVEDLVINTANWIIGGLDENAVKQMLKNNGISEDSASTFLDIVKNKVKEENLC